MMVPLPAYDIVSTANDEQECGRASRIISLRQRELSHDFGISLRSSSKDCDGQPAATQSLISSKSAVDTHVSMNQFLAGRNLDSQYQSMKSFNYNDDMQEKERMVGLMITSNSSVHDQQVDDNKLSSVKDNYSSTLNNPVDPIACNKTTTRKFIKVGRTSFEHEHLPPATRHRRNSVRRKRSSVGMVRPRSEGKGPPVNSQTLKALQKMCQSDGVRQNRGTTAGSTSNSSRLQYQTSLPNLPEFQTDMW